MTSIIIEIYNKEPNFTINALQILQKHREFIKITEFENEYTETF